VRGPDGSLTAWYELTSATLDQAKETLGAAEGCRYEANATGGSIDSGDLELRVRPSGDPFDGEISAFLNTRRPGPAEQQLRPAGEGYRLAEEAVHDVTAEPGTTSEASWSLTPE
jgi:hypothetical protein